MTEKELANFIEQLRKAKYAGGLLEKPGHIDLKIEWKKNSKTKLEVKQAPGKGTFIKDQKLQIVTNAEELSRLFQLGSKNRAIRQTSFNKRSSRSHCLFTIYIESGETLTNGQEMFKVGKLNLVDLAGS